MKFVALLSGGKDSVHCMLHCIANGHVPVVIGNLKPPKIDEMDSFMYQTVGHEMIEHIASALNLPLIRQDINGGSVRTDMQYVKTHGDEVEDLLLLLERVLAKYPDVRGVSCGALLSNYQRIRVEGVCDRLGLQSLSYLWQRKQDELLDEMIDTGMEAIAVKVACMGLAPHKHVGKSLSNLRTTLHKLSNQFGAHICGEGGEYESLVLDCPLFRKRIMIDESEIVMHSDDSFAPVGYLRVRAAHLEDKNDSETHLPPPPNWSEIHSAEEMASAQAWATSILAESTHTADAVAQHLSATMNPSIASSVAVPVDPPMSCEPPVATITHSCCVTTSRGGTVCYVAGLSLPPPAGKSADTPTGKSADPNTEEPPVEDRHATSATHTLPALSVEEETAIVLDLLERELDRHGMRACHVMQTHLYLDSMADFARVNGEYKKRFTHSPPARVCVATCLNGRPSKNPAGDTHRRRLLLDCVAWSPTISKTTATTVDGTEGTESGTSCPAPPAPLYLHVQGLSYWAPANIGPYGQSVTDAAHKVMHMAGQIGLDPPTMTLVPTVTRQSLRALQSSVAVMAVGDASLRGVLTAICLVVDSAAVPAARESFERFCKNGSEAAQDNDDWALELLPMVQFVQVTELPRNADVEWHFVTCTASTPDAMGTIPNVLGTATLQSALRYSLSSSHGYLWFDVNETTPLLDLKHALRLSSEALSRVCADADVDVNGDDGEDAVPHAKGDPRYALLRVYATATPTARIIVGKLMDDATSIGMTVSIVPVVWLPNAAGAQCGVYFWL
eukprot:m.354832 g.354832  ORF g.354832 m.354832 type:complete len:787 (+) comp20727_c0_seq1:289-2649(+)